MRCNPLPDNLAVQNHGALAGPVGEDVVLPVGEVLSYGECAGLQSGGGVLPLGQFLPKLVSYIVPGSSVHRHADAFSLTVIAEAGHASPAVTSGVPENRAVASSRSAASHSFSFSVLNYKGVH